MTRQSLVDILSIIIIIMTMSRGTVKYGCTEELIIIFIVMTCCEPIPMCLLAGLRCVGTLQKCKGH